MSAKLAAKPAQNATQAKAPGKKKGKSQNNIPPSQTTSAPSDTPERSGTPTVEKLNGNHESENGEELPAVREISKNIRNTTKKLAAMSKLDAIIHDNPDLSLDDLVATRKINNDQKAQALKRPALQAQLAQYEEQLVMVKGIEESFTSKLESLKAKYEAELDNLRTAHNHTLSPDRNHMGTKVQSSEVESFRSRFLILTRFLRAAAARRQIEADEQDESALAFEGVLLALYGGDSNAVFAAEHLVDGSSEPVSSPDGTVLSLNYEKVRELTLKETPFEGAALYDQSHPDRERFTQLEIEDGVRFGTVAALDDVARNNAAEPATDPTMAHAGLTELDAVQAVQQSVAREGSDLPAAVSVGDGAANAAGADRWDNKASEDPMEGSYEIVPRPDAEVETPAHAAPVNSTASWADDAPEQVSGAGSATPSGFQEVPHRSQRGRGGHFSNNHNHHAPGTQQSTNQSRRGGGYHQSTNGRGNHTFGGRGRGEGRGRGGHRGGRGRGTNAGVPGPVR